MMRQCGKARISLHEERFHCFGQRHFYKPIRGMHSPSQYLEIRDVLLFGLSLMATNGVGCGPSTGGAQRL
ncbi:MAG: hypothetical protein J7459_14410 [Chloroflexus sp.]|jgi:hypothetical protein|nr:hypothetical protein [Chloroflexus sp.]